GGDQVDGSGSDAIVVGWVALARRQLEDEALGGIERRAQLLHVLQALEAVAPLVAAGAPPAALLRALLPRPAALDLRHAPGVGLRSVVADWTAPAATAAAT